MQIMYHSDIIPKIQMAFTSAHQHPSAASRLLESLAIHRIEHLKIHLPDGTEISPIDEVGYTIQAYVHANPEEFGQNTNIQVKPYLPEHLGPADSRDLIVNMCSAGRFIPFILVIDNEDIEHAADSANLLHILAGFGKDSDCNFMMVTINMENLMHELNIQSDREDRFHLIYPVMFDCPSKLLVSTISAESVSLRAFVMQPNENSDLFTAEVIDNGTSVEV